MPMSEQVYQLNVWFEGHVQGVGFRYKTLQLAKGFEVTGQVSNLSDGRVHLLAEGEASEVRAFCEEVAEQMESFIRESQHLEAVAPRAFEGFTIGH